MLCLFTDKTTWNPLEENMLCNYFKTQVFLQPQFSIARYQVKFEIINTDCMKTTGSVNLHMILWLKCLLNNIKIII